MKKALLKTVGSVISRHCEGKEENAYERGVREWMLGGAGDTSEASVKEEGTAGGGNGGRRERREEGTGGGNGR